jgi:hypothetical protein
MQWMFSDERAAYREALRGWLTKVAGAHDPGLVGEQRPHVLRRRLVAAQRLQPSVVAMPTPGERMSTIRRSRELSSSAICSASRPPREFPTTETWPRPSA